MVRKKIEYLLILFNCIKFKVLADYLEVSFKALLAQKTYGKEANKNTASGCQRLAVAVFRKF